MIQEFIRSIKVTQVMAAPLITVKETDEFHVVWEKMETYDIRHLPVINDIGCLVGMISQRQLYKIHSPRKLEDGSWYYETDSLDSFILSKVMMKDAFVLNPHHSLEDVMKAMTQFKYGSIPITDENRVPLGIITRNDVIKFFLRHG